MEIEDKSMERQKLVQNDEEEDVTLPTSATTQSKTPISPPNVYSGSESHSQSLGKTSSSEAKLAFVNERKTIELENARKASVERKKKMLKDSELPPADNNLIDLKRDASEVEKVVDVDVHDKINSPSSQKSNISLPVPSTSHQQNHHHPVLLKNNSKNSLANSLHNFSSRTIKHHTFDSGFQDVKNMEKNLISLLDDFHNGKLRAFSGSSMMEMKNIRDQQEKLSKLHFDLGMSTTNSNDSKTSDHMAQLVQRLNEISHSIEKLNSSNVD